MSSIRPCGDDERAVILKIINSAAEAYRGVLPADRWHEPYMSADELSREIAAGVAFVPGAAFFFDARGANTLRLSYSLANEAQIDEGIARMAALL